MELFQLSELFLFAFGEKSLGGGTRERGVRGESLGDSRAVAGLDRGG